MTGAIPEKATEGAAGYDVKSVGFTCVDTKKHVDVRPVFTAEYLERLDKKPFEPCVVFTDDLEGYKQFMLSPYNVFFTGNAVIMKPLTRVMVDTNIFMAVSYGYECQVRSRSGLSAIGLIVAQGVGTIDSDYRGEVKVCINNISGAVQTLKTGERIAQLVFAKVEDVVFNTVDKLSDTDRGAGGFGSTGKN